MSLEPFIRHRLAERQALGEAPILLMSHLVLGHPSLDENRRVIDAMAGAGVELMELQIPFSEPIADGPVIAQANQLSLDAGFRVADGLAFAREMVRRHPGVAFLIMTYANILMAYGVERFMRAAAEMGMRGLIIPDWPPQVAGEPMGLCAEMGLDWVQLFTPTSTDERLGYIGGLARGFCYCVARKGVTGAHTDFNADLTQFLSRCRQVTGVPLAVGFGVGTPADVAALCGQAEIAVVGTAAMRIHAEQGAEAVGAFFRGLRQGVA
ncbi:Tryptophan synthase alpha chain [Candidatus Magnetaquicoccaceae bacterium FCR-1]|uniref:Tryptophan synthase alpha chain n=1 Tax=Candidatus Magnetaquiglobus chichijimensis TaxID=3141448 RepID=A0ABQ0C4E8_9PROT